MKENCSISFLGEQVIAVPDSDQEKGVTPWTKGDKESEKGFQLRDKMTENWMVTRVRRQYSEISNYSTK